MKNLSAWKFSEATTRIDLRRIAEEASCVPRSGGLTRVTVDAKYVFTIVSRALFIDFLTHAPEDAVNKIEDAEVVPVAGFSNLTVRFGDFGVAYKPEPFEFYSPFYMFKGDLVGLFAARKEVSVEVF